MSNDIRIGVARADGRVNTPDGKKSSDEPGKAADGDRLRFEGLLAGLGRGIAPERPESRPGGEEAVAEEEEVDSRREGLGADLEAFGKKRREEEEGGEAAAIANPFALAGRLASAMTPREAVGPAARTEGRTAGAALDRAELAARINEVAEALMVKKADPGAPAEARLELKPELLPETSVRIVRDASVRWTMVEFSTPNARSNALLLDAAAGLKNQLSVSLGGEVVVRVDYRDNTGYGSDERGRDPDWEILSRDGE